MDKFGAEMQLSICHEKNFNKLNVTIMDVRGVFLPSLRLGFYTEHKQSREYCIHNCLRDNLISQNKLPFGAKFSYRILWSFFSDTTRRYLH